MGSAEHPFSRAGAVFFLLLLGGCRAPERHWPFPPVPAALSDAEVLATIESRVSGVRSLYAVLAMSFDIKGGRGGVMDAVVRYEHPGRIRMTAFKDLLISSRGIFDLVLDQGRFFFDGIDFEGDGGPKYEEGDVAELARLQPGFRAMAGLGEAMFLPGLIGPDRQARVLRRPEGIAVLTSSPTGHPLEWTLDPATLGVTRGILEVPGGRATVTYESYRVVDGVYVPEQFALDDPGAGVRVSGILEELEANPELEEDDFRLEKK